MSAHTHVPIRKAVLIIVTIATFAWLVFSCSDRSQADAPTASLRATPIRQMQPPGSSLEGMNEPLSQIIWYNAAKANEERRAAEAAAAAERARQAAAAAARRVTPTATTSNTRPGGVNWDGIAQCETGGNWSMSGSRFSGGVGFANSTWSGAMHGRWIWSGYPDLGFPENAGDATREQQIIVAERVYAKFGLSGWGCRAFG